MTQTGGVVCSPRKLGITIVGGNKVEDHDLVPPANLADAGQRLAWWLDEAERLLRRENVSAIGLQQTAGGKFKSSPERHELEGVVKIAAHRAGVRCESFTRDGVRAKLGVPKAAGAYEALLANPEVKARPNRDQRDQYLLARAVAG